MDSATNRLNGAGINYDGSGNITLLDGVTYVHDPMNMTTLRNPDTDNAEWAAIYTADDERLAVWDTGKGEREQRWTLRSLSNQVLREFRYGPPQLGTLIFEDGFETGDTSAWSVTVGFAGEMTSTTLTPSRFGAPAWSIDNSYVYRGAALLADFDEGVIRNYHLDHLGSVRQLTDSEDGDVARSQDYLPYGAEVPSASGPALAFTGHEKDSHRAGGDDDLDYMHARYCSPVMGRFLSTDPKVLRNSTKRPQRWNRYSYALSSPLTLVDETGESPTLALGLGAGVLGGLGNAGLRLVRNLSSGKRAFQGTGKALGVGFGAGFVAGATLGIGTAILGTGTLAVVGSGAAGGAAGGFLQGAGNELIVEGNTNTEEVLAKGRSGAVAGGIIGGAGGLFVTPATQIVEGTEILTNALVQVVATEGSVLVELGGDVMEEFEEAVPRIDEEEEQEP